jgi:predicted Zn-dependent protease
MRTRSLLLIVAALVAGSAAFAQFDMLNKLKDAVTNKGANNNGNSTADTLNAAGQLGRGIAGIGPEEETNIGDSVALEIVGKYGGLVRDAAVLKRVNLVGRALARYAEGRELQWRFGVLNSDSINAFSAPDGWVFITRGLYNLARNDDALAGVLSHEIAHVSGRHALKIVENSNKLAGGVGVIASQNKNLSAANADLQKLGLSVGKVTTTLFENGYSPQTEYDADKHGHDLAKVTGYAPGGLRSVLVLLQQRGGDPKKTFATHPPLADRIKRLPDEPAPKL